MKYFDHAQLRFYEPGGNGWSFDIVNDAPLEQFASPSLAMDAAGHAHVIWTNAATDELRYATNTSGDWENEGVLDTHDEGPDSRLVLGADDVLHVISHDPDWILVHAYRTVPDGRDRNCDGR